MNSQHTMQTMKSYSWTNDSNESAQKYTAQPGWSDSRTNDSKESVLFSESNVLFAMLQMWCSGLYTWKEKEKNSENCWS